MTCGSAVERHRLAEDAGTAAVTRLPRGVTQEHRSRRRGQVLSRTKVAPENRRDSERPEEIVADAGAGDALGAVWRGQGQARLLVRGERVERLVETLPVAIVGVRQVRLREHLDRLVDADEPRRIAVRQRPEERGVDEGKDREAGTQPERECQHSRAGEPGVLPQLPQRKAAVLQEVAGQFQSAHGCPRSCAARLAALQTTPTGG